jgi:hypothetical protein
MSDRVVVAEKRCQTILTKICPHATGFPQALCFKAKARSLATTVTFKFNINNRPPLALFSVSV